MNEFPHLLWIREGFSYFRFPGLSQDNNLINAVFTRRGGISPPPFDTLNSSYSVGDDFQNVTNNLHKIKKVVGARKLVFMEQVHETGITTISSDNHGPLEEVPHTDALITEVAGTALLVKQADCQGVILFDPRKGILGVVHCGWRGNVHNILGRVIREMKKKYGCDPGEVRAAIGPSLGPCCGEFADYKKIFPEGFEEFSVGRNHFDLWSLSRRQLKDEGVEDSNIEIAGICTRCRKDLFYSYRGEGTTGRFATVAMLRE